VPVAACDTGPLESGSPVPILSYFSERGSPCVDSLVRFGSLKGVARSVYMVLSHGMARSLWLVLSGHLARLDFSVIVVMVLLLWSLDGKR
jgi:hypothetical protein